MGWEELLSIAEQNRVYRAEEAATDPASCPNDGHPLQTGPDGWLYCVYDGWRPLGAPAMPG